MRSLLTCIVIMFCLPSFSHADDELKYLETVSKEAQSVDQFREKLSDFNYSVRVGSFLAWLWVVLPMVPEQPTKFSVSTLALLGLNLGLSSLKEQLKLRLHESVRARLRQKAVKKVFELDQLIRALPDYVQEVMILSGGDILRKALNIEMLPADQKAAIRNILVFAIWSSGGHQAPEFWSRYAASKNGRQHIKKIISSTDSIAELFKRRSDMIGQHAIIKIEPLLGPCRAALEKSIQ